MEKIGIIDLGSNSARLVIVNLFTEGHFMVVDELKESVRLGQDMDRDGFLKPQRVAETIKTLKMFKRLCDSSSVDRIIAVATAAVRRAKNQRSFLDEIQATCNIKIRVLSEKEEATLVYRGVINVGDMVAYMLFINMFVNPIKKLIQFVEMFQNAITGYTRFQELMNIEIEQEAPDAVDLKDVRGEITFDNVSFQYDEGKEVLSNISMTFPQGEMVAIVGPSGGGKTTLCHLIPRFYEITQGSICIDGQDIRKVTRRSLRSKIGIVQQDVFLFTGTIFDNIAYGKLGASREEVYEAAKKANIHDYIMSLPEGYDTFVGERGVKLSGGQKQRISIARVFLKNPPILILDEATSALDNVTENYIQDSLDELCKNRTTIVVAHRLSTIKNADEIIVMDRDGIQERGTHTQLLEKDNGIYRELYEAQFARL